jgi:1-aminocyclopropane-1-carboxylate deaminase/D-cysteine desulfhydrase-like pyridoxal-dependent ACC family enzyme
VATALGDGYARPTADSTRLAAAFRAAEGLELDGTYTAKALDGAMRFIKEHRNHDSVHLLWHTYHALPGPAAAEVGPSDLPAALRRYLPGDTASSA